MKVWQRGAASIVVSLVMVWLPAPVGAADATCGESYLLCINEASQVEGYWARTRAEQGCNYDWYRCVRRQAFGA